MEVSLLALLATAMPVVIGSAFSGSDNSEVAAVESAAQWLALVDEGNISASWDQSAKLLKSSMQQEQWTKMLQARLALGRLESRKLMFAKYAKASVPGAPNGEFFVIQYDSSFEHKKSILEMVTPILEEDGQWRVAGYSAR